MFKFLIDVIFVKQFAYIYIYIIMGLKRLLKIKYLNGMLSGVIYESNFNSRTSNRSSSK